MEKYGKVLDKHVASPKVDELEMDSTLEEIYLRDINWIKKCDILVAEVSTPSLGVGYELAYAESLGKRIICVYATNINISAMIGGNKKFELIEYNSIDELMLKLDKILININKN